MHPRQRDGLLSVAGLLALLAATARTVGLHVLARPGAALGGVAGTLALEAAFLRYPDRLLALWERPGVPAAGLAGLLTAGAAVLRRRPAAVGALVWGLVTYLALLACVLTGRENPLKVVAGSSEPAYTRQSR